MTYSSYDSLKSFSGLRVAVLAATPSSGEKGGAERLFEALHKGFCDIGCAADLIYVPADEPNFEQILKNYSHCREMDLSGYDMVVSTKVPTYAIRHPNHVLFLMHTVRVFDDMFDNEISVPTRDHFIQRSRVHQADYAALLGVKVRFAQSHEVSRRLYKWRGFECQVLHPPLAYNKFRKGPPGDYFFLPGRLHKWKRVHLVIEAIRKSKLPLKLIITGKGEAETDLRRLASGDERIQFLGRISDEELVGLYAGALAVPFVPIHEDYGFVTLEAFASGKPVITCADSGEATYFVANHETGFVCQPDPDSVRKALEWLFHNPDKAAQMGENGSRRVGAMSWKKTAAILAGAAMSPARSLEGRKYKVTVLDMQPIDPPVGGGRLRLLGLYHNLGSDTECRYVGTYDWPGERYRAHALTETLFETDVPLSDAHHAAAADLARRAGGKGVIDIAFSHQATLSPAFLEKTHQELAEADIVIFSHPWVYPLVKDSLRPSQVIIYDSHNVEGFLRAQLLNERNLVEADLLRQVVQDEYDIGARADWIWACSHEDLLRFNRVFGFSPDKMRVVPNGVMAFTSAQPDADSRRKARLSLGVAKDAFVAIFIGSPWAPNVQAAKFIDKELADLLPGVTFVIAGGVGAGMSTCRKNVIITGPIDEAVKYRWFHAADIGVNPMMSGSGTNIKMFDFMAMSLPVVSTAVGARGIDAGARQFMLVAEPTPSAFCLAIEQLRDDTLRSRMGFEARQCVEDDYAWERISEKNGVFLKARARVATQPRPMFSVVIPTYERHEQLNELIRYLQAQIERDFEVVVVDQSSSPWLGAGENYGFPLVYFHSPVKGAVYARNAGAFFAQGRIIAFTDDDCQPAEDWLLNARPYFTNPAVVGIEGIITSDHIDDPAWRPVMNVGFVEGMAFMTANLMVRSSVFQYLGGFDKQFDRPHFREDTDFGWQMLDIGLVPFARDVKVFHPAQPRANERESHVERTKFFIKDARLYRKNPERYRQLFIVERQFDRIPGFRENLSQGFEIIGEDMPKWMLDMFQPR